MEQQLLRQMYYYYYQMVLCLLFLSHIQKIYLLHCFVVFLSFYLQDSFQQQNHLLRFSQIGFTVATGYGTVVTRALTRALNVSLARYTSQHSSLEYLQPQYSIRFSIFCIFTLSLIDLYQFDIQIFYGFQIDGICQCVNRS